MKVLVTAAAGRQGKFVIPKLSAAGHIVRAARLTPGKDEELKALGADEVFVGDMSDLDTYCRALEGCDAVYHVGPGEIAREKECGMAMIEAARRNGTRHVVYSSVYHTIIDILQHRYKRDVEEKLFESGLNWTVLRPCDYMQTGQHVEVPWNAGIYPVLWQAFPGRRGSLIDPDDLSDAAARVLTEGSKHYFADYELAGPDKLTCDNIARILSRVMGKEIKVAYQPPEIYVNEIRFAGCEPTPASRHVLAVMTSIAAWYSKYDFIGNPNVLEWLLGRPATSFETFVRRTLAKKG